MHNGRLQHVGPVGRFAALPAASSLWRTQSTYLTRARGEQYRTSIFPSLLDPTHDENGDFPDGCVAAAPISQSEWAFFYSDVVVPLNQAVATAASTHGWHLAGGIASAFLTHGYCTSTSQRWIVRVEDSLFIQGNQLGSGHPNLAGQSIYRNSLVNSIIAFTPPETTATAMAGGRQSSFGAWTPYKMLSCRWSQRTRSANLASGRSISQLTILPARRNHVRAAQSTQSRSSSVLRENTSSASSAKTSSARPRG